MENYKISIIICTYNRDKYIYNVLKSIIDNDFSHEKYEIILINNNSNDFTESECKRFQNDYPEINFRYFIENNQGLSYARNRGIKESQGDILIYIDDDATVNDLYLKTYADFFDRNKMIYAAGGPIIPHYETQEPKWMSHYTKQLITGYLYKGNKIIKFSQGSYPGGGNAAYRKEVFDKVGLFNVDLGRKGNSLVGAEEKDIFDKMTMQGLQFYYLPNAILYHIISDSKLSDDYFTRLTFSIGQSERMRTLHISRKKYYNRLLLECVKWGVTILLFFVYAIVFQLYKGCKLIKFRWNVTNGLLKNGSL